MSNLRVGFVVNPIAGLGGAVALKGSDGKERQELALALGAKPRAPEVAAAFCAALKDVSINWFTPPGEMGGQYLNGANIITQPGAELSAEDTQQFIKAAAPIVDCLVFVGGDGTARDVLASLDADCVVLGVPAGVKLHSGVFAVSARAAAEVVRKIAVGELVNSVMREVRDYEGEGEEEIRTRTFGELRVPESGVYLQRTKEGGKESEPLALNEIAADLLERLDSARPLVFGPGGTVQSVQSQFAPEMMTLRGFDVLQGDGAWALDVGASFLEGIAAEAHFVLSFTRHQGFLLGRGNHQLSTNVLEKMRWPDAVDIVATRTKLNSLEGRPLWVDTGSLELDQKFIGLANITTGYEETMLHRIAPASAPEG